MSQILSTPRQYTCHELGVCKCPPDECQFVELSEPQTEPTPTPCHWEQIAFYVTVAAVLVLTVVFGSAMGAYVYYKFMLGA